MFDRYAAFIIPSYLATLLVMAAVIVWILLTYRSRLREIADLEAKGVRRGGQREAGSPKSGGNP